MNFKAYGMAYTTTLNPLNRGGRTESHKFELRLNRSDRLPSLEKMNSKTTHVTDDVKAIIPPKPPLVENFEAIFYLIIAILHLHNSATCCDEL